MKSLVDKGEKVVYMAIASDYKGFMVFFYKGGKVSKVEMNSYYTKTNRKKLIKAYSDKDDLVSAFYLQEDSNFIITSSSSKILIFNTSMVSLKQSKSTQGISVMKQKKGHRVIKVEPYVSGTFISEKNYIPKTLPSMGKFLESTEDSCEQLKLN